MAITVEMGQDGFLRVTLDGEMDRISADIFMQELTPYMEAATVTHPLHMIIFAGSMGKLSPRIRRYFTEANRDERTGYVVIIEGTRRLRVLAQFISKAVKRENIFFVNSEKEALEVIAEQRAMARATAGASR